MNSIPALASVSSRDGASRLFAQRREFPGLRFFIRLSTLSRSSGPLSSSGRGGSGHRAVGNVGAELARLEAVA